MAEFNVFRNMRVLVAADGESSISRDELALRTKLPEKVVVADGALRHVTSLELIPDYIVGDLDSVDESLLSKYESAIIERYPRDKDKTDLEIALERALSLKPSEIIFIGMFGGRVDHQFGNILLLTTIKNVKLRIEDRDISGFVLNDKSKIEIKRSLGFSLIPLTSKVTGVCVSGAKWNLFNHTLTLGAPTALCNEFIEDEVTVSIESGALLVIQRL